MTIRLVTTGPSTDASLWKKGIHPARMNEIQERQRTTRSCSFCGASTMRCDIPSPLVSLGQQAVPVALRSACSPQFLRHRAAPSMCRRQSTSPFERNGGPPGSRHRRGRAA